jgi:3',5'-cyclic AMP phosphodiesterase CpdA
MGITGFELQQGPLFDETMHVCKNAQSVSQEYIFMFSKILKDYSLCWAPGNHNISIYNGNANPT